MDGSKEGLQLADSRKRPGRGLKLREASFKDHDQIALLASRYGLSKLNYEEWSNQWLGNPVYRELQPSWVIGWVLEDGNGRIVGYIGNVPSAYEFEGRRLLATSSHAWVAEPEYRSAALLLLDRVINQPDVDLYLSNTVGATSAPGVRAFGGQRVPAGVWDEYVWWITNYRSVAKGVLMRRNYPLAALLSYPLSAALQLRDRGTRRALGGADVEVRAYPAFDERFDDFWDDLRRCSPHLLLAVRTREVLAWHFKHALLERRLWIVTVVDGSRIVAYALFERADDPNSGASVVRLVDFQSLDGVTALLPPLLAWALRKCRDEGIHRLGSVGCWLEKGELLDAIAPYRRRLSAWTYFYRANSPGLAERLRDRRTWAPSLFDGDASLVRWSGFF